MKKILLISILFLLTIAVSAQQRPVHSLYMFDPLLINPAYAGTQVQLSATAIYRNQWVNFPGSPKTFTASAHSGFRKARVGVGFLASNDQIGIHAENSFYGMYSYRLPFSKYNKNSYVSFGLQGGFNNIKSDFSILNPKDQNDPFASLVERNLTWNFGSGIFIKHKDAYLGISVPYILNNQVINAEVFSSEAQRYRYYYLNAGFTKKVAENVKFMPSALVRFQERAPLSLDLNLMTVLYDAVAFGLSYRLGDSLVGLFEVQINENFHAGYAYDFTTTEVARFSNGTHEIMINYRIKIPALHKGLPCPSYY